MKQKLLLLFLISALIFIGQTPLSAKQEKPSLTPLEKLGQRLFNDRNLSLNGNQSCQTCHHPAAKFADPENRFKPFLLPVSDGSVPTLFGGRNAPTAAYTKFSPPLFWDGELFIGGLFWDGRASGNVQTATGTLGAGPTGDPLADQAKGPFLNPVEMALGDESDVVERVLTSSYRKRFLFEFARYHGYPYAPEHLLTAYNFISLAIAEFEKSHVLNKFSSRFDNFLAEQGGDVSGFGVEKVTLPSGEIFRKYVGPPKKFRSRYFSYREADGLAIFNADSYQQLGLKTPRRAKNGAMCYLCHLTENHDDGVAPVFTDFSYDNLGIPVNPQIAELAGPQPIDYGLGAQTDILDGAAGSPSPEWATDQYCKDADCTEKIAAYPSEVGKFKVSSLRNIARTAPYGHNGFFATLGDIVNFYNRRDALADAYPDMFAPEVAETVNDGELGNLGLTSRQERRVVLFLRTLTDR
jgi:cytochrome c peroxidase